MKQTLLALILLLPVTLLTSENDHSALAARLKTFTKTSTVAQADQNQVLAENFLITDPAGPFRFQKVGKIRKITQITITLTLTDGTTAAGSHDHGDLTLALDGINTGLLLNGFSEAGTDTLTLSGVPTNEAQLRAALKVDGALAATIFDADLGDNLVTGSSANTTTLVIQGKRKR